MKNLTIFLLLITASFAYSDENVLLFKPYTANIFEPRIGSVINLTNENLRLDIGASFDLYRDSAETFSLGGDFFTYTRLRSENNFKFPVETSDYYFGINSSLKFNLFSKVFQSRLRLAHISSHLVDGYSKEGIFYKLPFVYSREFFDLSVAYPLSKDNLNHRFYIGSVYVFSTMPSDVNDLIFYAGYDYTKNITNYLQLAGGAEIRTGEKNNTNLALQLGINLKFYKNFGIFAGYYKYSGSSIHGMFYDKTDNYDGIGFQIVYF